MVIRIPESMFGQGSGHVGASGEPDFETRSALAAARASEQEFAVLSRGLGLVGEAMKGGATARKQLAAARAALGRHGNSGALRALLDRAAAGLAEREAADSRRAGMRTLVGTIKSVGALPLSFTEKAELGRTLLQHGLKRGLVAPEDHQVFEAAVMSQLGLMQAQTAIAKTTEPGEALEIANAIVGFGSISERRGTRRSRQAYARWAYHYRG